jgi:hypothetical protein
MTRLPSPCESERRHSSRAAEAGQRVPLRVLPRLKLGRGLWALVADRASRSTAPTGRANPRVADWHQREQVALLAGNRGWCVHHVRDVGV